MFTNYTISQSLNTKLKLKRTVHLRIYMFPIKLFSPKNYFNKTFDISSYLL